MKTKQVLLFSLALAATVALTNTVKANEGHRPQPTFQQQSNPFASFRTHRQGKGITAVWSVASADAIVAFSVQRTDQDPTDPFSYWEELTTVPFSTARNFTYKDGEVPPGVITYRIVALMADGSTEVSALSSVRIVRR